MEIWRFIREEAQSIGHITTHYARSIYFNKQILESLTNVHIRFGLKPFVVETERKIVGQSKRWERRD
jgi:hypothetical protein